MTLSRRLSALSLVSTLRVGTLFLLLLGSPCLAQGEPNPGEARLDPQTYGRRTDAFRRLLFELHFQPVLSFAELEMENPSESLFIMLGDPRCLSEGYLPAEKLRSFVEKGGAVLIATDKITEHEAEKALSDLAGVTVTGEKLVLRQHGKSNDTAPRYDNSKYCPFVEPIEASTALNRASSVFGAMATLLGSGGRPDLFRRGAQPDQPRLAVATNAPSRLKITKKGLPSGIHRLAQLPADCEDETAPPPLIILLDEIGKRFKLRARTEPPLFAVGGTIGKEKGRVLVLADHSIFINRMMLFRDNGNLEFAANCLHWLRGGASTQVEALKAANSPNAFQQLIGKRNHVLFWDDGVVHNNFEVPLRKVPLPPVRPSEQAIVAAIDKTIARLEDEDYFNNELYASMNYYPGGRQRVYRYGVYLLTLAAGMLLAYRFLWRTRHRLEAAVPLLEDAIREHEPNVSLLDQRRRALLGSGNLWEMGHHLVREFFASAGVALTGASPPRVEMAHGGWRQRWRWRRSVDRLWRLARSNAPVPLSPAALQYRLRELEELKSALANGTIVLNAEGKINHGLHG